MVRYIEYGLEIEGRSAMTCSFFGSFFNGLFDDHIVAIDNNEDEKIVYGHWVEEGGSCAGSRNFIADNPNEQYLVNMMNE